MTSGLGYDAESTESEKGKVAVLILGIIVLILGTLSIMSPLVAGTAVATLVGVLLVAAGITRVLWAFKAETFGRGALVFLLGGVTAFAGVVTLVRPLVGLASLTMVLAVYFVVDGICSIFASFQLKPATGRGWALFDGIITLLLGAMIWRQWPLSGQWAVGVLVGVRLIMAGWAMIFLGSAIRGVSKALKSEAH